VTWSVSKGDAFDLLLREGPGSVDLILTSPPYWGQRTYGLEHDDSVLAAWNETADDPFVPPGYGWYREQGGQLGLEPYPEWFIAHLVEIFGRAQPALRPSGSLWVNLGDTYFARWSSLRDNGRQGIRRSARRRRKTPSGGWRRDKQLLLIPARFAIAMQEAGWILRNDLIWWKETVAPRPERDRLRLSHEHFFHFVQRSPGGRSSYHYDLGGAETGAFDVIRGPAGKRVETQTATFPLEVVRPRILSSCPPGGVVLDPFCGSGTTLAAALSAGRDARGYDMSQASVELARRTARSAAQARRMVVAA
jgi:site-specific DNA-methyltransferase (adenine-specific)